MLGAEVPAGEKWFSALRRAYSAPTRAYHSLEHIDAVLTEIDQAGARMVKDPQALYLAAWFHDSVYDVLRNDNEQRSAAAAVNVMSAMKLSKERMRSVQETILCTRDHRCDSPDGRILIDADLAILGSAPETYRKYADAIKRECASIPEDRFRLGRMKVLQSLLGRGKIFQTMRGQRTYEEPARRNLARELAELTMSRPKLTTTIAPASKQLPQATTTADPSPVAPNQIEQPRPTAPVAKPTTDRAAQPRKFHPVLTGERPRNADGSRESSKRPAKRSQ